MSEHLVALLLIIVPHDPGGIPERVPPARHRALEEVAFMLELWPLDKGGWGPDYSRDLAWCRQVYRDSAGCPPLADAYRFPPRDVALPLVEFSYRHICWLESVECVYLHRADEVMVAIEEARWCCNVWAAVRDAGGEDMLSRRYALRRLRELLGEEAYHAGQLPPCVPVWRFREIR